MQIYLIILFSTMIIFAVGYRVLLIVAYSNADEAQKYKESLKASKHSWIRKIIAAIDAVGGFRLLIGYIGLVGFVLTVLYWEDK